MKSGLFPGFPAKSKEPVVHSGEWTTSSCEIGGFPWFPAKSKELVVHSGKWATGSHVIEAFSGFLDKSEKLGLGLSEGAPPAPDQG